MANVTRPKDERRHRTMRRHNNDGLRKRCDCPRRGWAKCPHPWHFNFTWSGEYFRFPGAVDSPDHPRHRREMATQWATLGDPITSKTAAESNGTGSGRRSGRVPLQRSQEARPERDTLTLEKLFDTYTTRYLEQHRAATLAKVKYQSGRSAARRSSVPTAQRGPSGRGS